METGDVLLPAFVAVAAEALVPAGDADIAERKDREVIIRRYLAAEVQTAVGLYKRADKVSTFGFFQSNARLQPVIFGLRQIPQKRIGPGKTCRAIERSSKCIDLFQLSSEFAGRTSALGKEPFGLAGLLHRAGMLASA